MADITAHYKLSTPSDSIGEAQRPTGFWVAATESTSEVIGYLGLDSDYLPRGEPSIGQLRRMVVSARHRRRRIGSLLITAALDHAKRHSDFEMLELETTLFQPAAQALYKKHGFEVFRSRVMRLGPFYSVKVLGFRRPVKD
ncbi:acyl-CoA N-acyltransferase [Mycena pura]|uniref:Acyl-CoA N-acyltransferase n=1 Tax=Mycena pura TaxID=153505 RepID=A0AAD6Y427_9AGAR|nr:acyl-CoA N-acyltransferase [Mycena pura]